MPVKKILLGQVWKKDNTGDNYLVTKLYSEVFSTYAMLRRVNGEEVLRIKVDKSGDAADLKGFTYTQESADF
jgi:hypothetical protein